MYQYHREELDKLLPINMTTSALSSFCVLFLLFSASHMLLRTEATRNLQENKATGNFSIF
jgi:hypothetical protein